MLEYISSAALKRLYPSEAELKSKAQDDEIKDEVCAFISSPLSSFTRIAALTNIQTPPAHRFFGIAKACTSIKYAQAFNGSGNYLSSRAVSSQVLWA